VLNIITATERILNLFNQERSSSKPNYSHAPEQSPDDQIKDNYERLSHSIRLVSPVVDTTQDEKLQPRNLCPVWRSEEDLPEAAKVLYGKAAELASIKMITLIRAAKQVERQLELWCIQKTKGDIKGKGKGKVVVINNNE
jgi:RNA polymerase I-specific transcription initiation factor RRN7